MIFGIDSGYFFFLAAVLAMQVITSTDEARLKAPWLHLVFSVSGILMGALLLSDSGQNPATRIYAGLILVTIVAIELKAYLDGRAHARTND